PLLAFAVRHLGTAAGVMITASHNPAADNGYKLYLSDGAQVIPPADADIEKRIAGLGPLARVPVAAAGSPLITRHGDEIVGADLVVASDPDGDRLAVAVPVLAPGGTTPPNPPEAEGWRMLTGDQVGALLGASLLDRTAGQAAPQARLVASTVVSSTLLSKIAAAAHVHYAETLTGFKWIARAADHVPGARFVLGYEEALGYAVGDVVRDKDGFGAALAMLQLAAAAKSAARSVLN